MIRRWASAGLVLLLIGMAIAGAYTIQRAYGRTPLSITGPNLLENSDFAQDDDSNGLPDGWERGADGVRISRDALFQPNACCSVYIQGISNYLKSPYIAAQPESEYRVALRALTDIEPGASKGSPTQIRIWFHWRDAEATEIAITKTQWQDVPLQSWSLVSALGAAPENAAALAISIHVAGDEPVVVTDLSLGQLGVRVNPWPGGKRAALAFSFDYETAMGGLVHSKSVGDPYADQDPLDRAQRMRQGVDEALRLFTPHGIRATFYTNGYNFLSGNETERAFMGDPIYTWANTEHGWSSNEWQTRPWFQPDPHATEASAPEWYFGSQVEHLRQAGQDIQSHTFAHFSGLFVKADDWSKDVQTWNMVAGERDVAAATSLAFPWSSSANMNFNSWRILEQAGIRSVTRTALSPAERRSWIADRDHWRLRRLPGHAITVIPDTYLTPKPADRANVARGMQSALLNEGAIDVWAHTEEVTSAAQIAAWSETVEAAARDFWVAPVPEIVQYAEDIRQVTISVHTEQPQYRFEVRNRSPRDLRDVSLTLPFVPERLLIDGRDYPFDGTSLLLDLRRGAAIEVVLLGQPSAQGEAAWPA